ncbi:hypothetical protein E4U92_28990 [Streptomyces galbus]|jgi:hypothetical protein|uniref:Uncharacterized protein n=1 Tax=Streptomyces galbus TaxID=33898 RepID=A0A4U5WV80_STRGB|nr:hypothetical protein [Streptomyces galbus]TKT06375.1 hypothetical protein E4U92_28990 [Streptomyces galbus]
MLRSVLVAAFSAVVAFGTLNGLSTAKGDAQADSRWSVVVVSAAPADGADGAVATPDDSIWS